MSLMPTPYLFAPRFDHYVIAAIITAFCSLLLAAASRRTRGSDPLIWWAVSMILTAVGLLITTTAGITIADGATATSDMIRNDAAGALVLVGAGMGWSAACAFAGRPRRVVIGIAGAFVWLVAVQVPGIRDAVSIRMALSWAIMALYAGAVLEVMRADGQERLPSRPFFLLLIGACGVHDLVRALMALLGAEQTLQPLLAIITAIEAQVRAVGISFLVLAMTKERAELATSHARDIGEARRRFLAQMSHEVRTPLNGVLGLAQVLLHDRRLGGEQRQQVATLEAAGRHLLAIVNDALDLAQIDAGQLTFTIRPFNPTQALKACVALVQAAAEEKNITLTLQQVGELPTLMSGDTTRLRQVLLNLLWNALKFTPPGGTVTLRVGAGTDWLRCEIIDNGPGIPPEKQALLFHDFARLDPNNADGTGLGLAISARLVERMGGRLTYHSGPGGIGSLSACNCPGLSSRRRTTRWTMPPFRTICRYGSRPWSRRPYSPRSRPRSMRRRLRRMRNGPTACICSWWTTSAPTAWCCGRWYRRKATT
jgi:signal transduction histidine kinase